MTNATVSNVAKTIQECGLVIFQSHGDTDYENPNNSDDHTSRANTSYLLLTTYSGITSTDTKAHSGTYGTYYDCMRAYGYTYVNGQCIANHMTKNAPNSLVYMCMCYGMATNGMYKALRTKSVEAVYGYSQAVTVYGENLYMQSILGYVKDSYSFGQAVSKAKSSLGNWDPYYSSYSLSQAKSNRVAFPIVVSSEDAYPGQGKVDAVQTVKSTWTLYRDPIGSLPLLQQGGSQNTSLRVKTLQRMLIAKGYSCGSSGADGSFGSGTKSGVIKFQKAKGLTQDGIVGKNTWTALLKACQIQSGAKGDLVKLLQQILISLGYSCGSCGADGDFGSGTRSAVLKFQKEMGLSQDGIVGKDTWTRLLLAYFY
jgi:peptidoglycan hydrolase-like protein with peptidoglycan-binding domain